MKLFITITTTLFAVIGCVKEERTSTSVIINNNTEHTILITSFRDGKPDSSSIINLSNYDSYIIENVSGFGKSKVPIYFFNYFQNVDSTIVLWDNTYPITHMISDSFISTGKYIEFGSNRNLGNGNAYTKEISNESKRTIQWTVRYNFTEQDYLDAKE